MSATTHRVGHGEHPVIALHGWFGDARSFGPMEPWLSRDMFSYVFMDYRGYGARREIVGAYTIDEIATDTLSLADELGFDRFSLVGHSMGGMVLEKVAILAPDRIRRLVAIAPVPATGMRYDASTRDVLDRACGDASLRRAIIDRSTGGRLPASWLDWKVAYSLSTSTPEAFAAYLRAWADTDVSAQVVDRHRMKLLVGEHDPVFDHALMMRTYLRLHPQASCEVLRNAGHYPMNETPLALVSAIEAFLGA